MTDTTQPSTDRSSQQSSEGLDLTGDGGIIKKIIREGTGSVIPARAKAKGMQQVILFGNLLANQTYFTSPLCWYFS